MDDGKKFREMLIAVCEKYDKTPSKVYAGMIWEALLEYNNHKCIQAFNHVFRYGNFFKDIVSDLLEFLEEEKKTIDENKANMEADRIIRHLKTHGSSKKPIFEDPTTNYLMSGRWRWGGWSKHILEKELKWWHKEFVQAYNSYSATQVKQLLSPEKKMKKLIGTIGKSVN